MILRAILKVLPALIFAGHAFAQGIVTFNASSASGTGIKYSVGGVGGYVPVGNTIPGVGGPINIASYAASLGTPLNVDASGVPVFDSNWKLSGGIGHQIAPFAGSVPSFGMTTDASLGAGGSTFFVQFIIVGWTGAFANFASAATAAEGGQLVALGWSGSLYSGGARRWAQNTGTALSPAAMVVGLGGFNGLTLVVTPEPGTIALGGLGIAALLLFRRRK